MGILHRRVAFSDRPEGGNPAGVWIGEHLPAPERMQRIANEVGFSETAFVAPAHGHERTIRYYSPEAEVPFCGHATIATAAQLAEDDGDGVFALEATIGTVRVVTAEDAGVRTASLTSVPPRCRPAPRAVVDEALALLGWRHEDLDPSMPPGLAYGGAWHLVLAVREKSRLEVLEYDFEGLKSLMLREDWITLQLAWRSGPAEFHVRNPFPVGGVYEDPATGAAAAALGGYLREFRLLQAPVRVVLHQGHAMGRPSRLVVDIPETGGIVVTGHSVRLAAPESSPAI